MCLFCGSHFYTFLCGVKDCLCETGGPVFLAADGSRDLVSCRRAAASGDIVLGSKIGVCEQSVVQIGIGKIGYRN